MVDTAVLGLIQNAALLLAAAFGYDVVTSRHRLGPGLFLQVVSGAMLGVLGCALILSPWTFGPGIVFDTRSVLLCVAGLFFGTTPTVVAMLMTAAFRLSLGGAAAWAGVAVIVASGAVGIAWRHLRRRPLAEIAWPELYLFGLFVHLAMLMLMFLLPRATALQVLSRLGLPVLAVYPVATVLLGMLMVNRLQREHDAVALLANQERIRLFFERQGAGMAIVSPDKGWLEVNDELCRMLACPREELVRMGWAELIHPDDLEADQARFERLLAGAIEEYSLEKRLRRRDGGVVWVMQSVGCVRRADGTVDYLLALLVDISERKQAEEALAMFKSSVESASDAIGMATPEGRHFYQNQAFTELLGELGEGSPASAYVDKTVCEEVFATIMAGGRWDGEVEMYGRDGRVVSVYLRAYANRDRADRVVCLVGIHTDITARKRAEAALRESEERYRTLVNNLPGLAYRCRNDEQWTMLFFSQGVEQLTGYPAADFIDNAVRSFVSIIHPDDRLAVDRAVQAGVQGRQPYEMEYRLIRADNEIAWVYEKGQGIFDPSGSLLWLDGVIVDITEQRQAHAEKERLQAQLLQAQKMESVGRLAGGVAHDFNNMLQTILGYADLALGAPRLEDALHEYLLEIRQAARRSADLTRQLLAFARKQTVSPLVLDLNDTVASMLKMLQRLIGEDITLAWLPGHELWSVRIDPSQVDQLLANLMVNARDAISGPGTISIKTGNVALDPAFCARRPGAVVGEYVLLTVTDDGCGMDEATLAHVFEPFFTTKEQDKGTGLGLATVYGIVKQNSGFIDIDSVPGQGTSCRIYLPRFGAAGMAVEMAAGQQPRAAEGGTETVLVVEDEEAILKLGTRILGRLGYTVLAADGPAAALRLAEAYDGVIHLLLTDVVMPEMNGRELAGRLAALRPGIKRLFMSGYPADVIASHGVLEADLQLLQKPFTVTELAAKVREALVS